MMGVWDPARQAQIEARLFACIDVGRSPAGCWMWTGRFFRDGYGLFKVGERAWGAHRFVYQFLHGDVPDSLHLDHLCRERACVNPLHLEPVTPSENKLRAWNQNTDKSHCIHGHPFDDANTYVDPYHGWRQCRRCKQDVKRRYRARKKAAQ